MVNEDLRRVAADPSTSPATLAELAQAHPELWPTIAANPAAYPALRQWLESTDDPATLAALQETNGTAQRVPSKTSGSSNTRKWIVGIIGVLIICAGVLLVLWLNQAQQVQSAPTAAPSLTPTEILTPEPAATTSPEPLPVNGGYTADIYGWRGQPEGLFLDPEGSLYAIGETGQLFGEPNRLTTAVRVLPDVGPFASIADGGTLTRGVGVLEDGTVYQWGQKMTEDGSGRVGESAPRPVPGITDAIQAQVVYTGQFATTLLVLGKDGVLFDVENGYHIGPEDIAHFDARNRYVWTAVTNSGVPFVGGGSKWNPIAGVPHAVKSCSAGKGIYILDQSGDVYWTTSGSNNADLTAEIVPELSGTADLACGYQQDTGLGEYSGTTVLSEDGSVLQVSQRSSWNGNEKPIEPIMIEPIELPEVVTGISPRAAVTSSGQVFWIHPSENRSDWVVDQIEVPW